MEATSSSPSRRPQWRSTVMTLATSIVIVCIKLSWTNSPGHADADTGTLSTTEFLLHAQSNIPALKQQAIALQHVAALARRHSAKGSALHESSSIDEGPSISSHRKDSSASSGQTLEEVVSNNTALPRGNQQGEVMKSNFVSHSHSISGWDKSAWSAGDWASWLITGPGISIAFSFFMFYTYGTLAGVLTLLVCGCIDLATFYYNW